MAIIEGKMIGKAAKGLGNLITGGAINEYQDRRQLRQQKKLQELQIEGSKELGLYNQQLALDTWNKTNYEAQRKHMENAGLNVGLMYGMSGGGGATTSYGGSGSVSGGNAQAEMGMGLQLGMQMQMQKAQIENIEADTQKKKVDAAKTAGVDTDVAKETLNNLAAQTNNEKLKGALIGLDTDLKAIEVEKGNRSMEDMLRQLKSIADKAKAEATSAEVKANVDQKTQDTTIQGMRNAVIEQGLRIAQQQKNLQLTDAQIAKIANDINMDKQGNMREWDKLNQQDRDRIAKQITEENNLDGKGIVDAIMALF